MCTPGYYYDMNTYLFHQDEIVPSTSTSTSSTPKGEKLHSTVTSQSRTDYTVSVYNIRGSKNLDLVAVLIEAKHTNNSSIKHAIAQVPAILQLSKIHYAHLWCLF